MYGAGWVPAPCAGSTLPPTKESNQMSLIVYATKWGAYHFHRDCPNFRSAQLLSDWDCGCDPICTHRRPRLHSLERMSSIRARMLGKWPCRFCVPEHLRSVPRSESDFGHRPVSEFTDTGIATRTICVRCVRWTKWVDVDPYAGRRVTWPCKSAVVLGLVDRMIAS